MRQFDVFENPDPDLARFAPHLVVLQSHHLSVLRSQVVAPIVRDAMRSLTPLDIPVDFRGESLVIAVAELAAVDVINLQRPAGDVANMKMRSAALDRVFTGF